MTAPIADTDAIGHATNENLDRLRNWLTDIHMAMTTEDIRVALCVIDTLRAAAELDLGAGETFLSVVQEENRSLVGSLQILESFTGTTKIKRHHAQKVRRLFARLRTSIRGLLAEVTTLRAEQAKDRQDAERWRYVRQFLRTNGSVRYFDRVEEGAAFDPIRGRLITPINDFLARPPLTPERVIAHAEAIIDAARTAPTAPGPT